jgi:uncharacterized membrane protein YfcA
MSGSPASSHANGPERPPAWSLLFDRATSLIGFSAGLLNGLIGIGGGIVIVPGLMLHRKLNVRVAVSTSLGAVVVLSLNSLSLHVGFTGFRFGLLNSIIVVAAGMGGAQAGGWLLNRIPRRLVILVFGSMTLFTAARLIAQALGAGDGAAAAPEVPPLWAYPLFGAVSGLFSGLLGIGGGGYVVLGFSVFFHTPIQGGLPIALLLNATNGLSGVWAQRGTGQVRWAEVWRLVPAALAGIGVGTWLALSLPADVLRVIFGVFFLVMAGRLFVHAWRGRNA